MFFASLEEAQAWSVFFASQCPRLLAAPAATVQAEIDGAAAAADAMLTAWRERYYAPDDDLEVPA